ncbi:MAG: hypothetical protein ACTHMG_12305 [Sphingomonas sp.]
MANSNPFAMLRQSGELGDEVELSVPRGERSFAAGDRVMFLRNERSLEVKNGTLGTIERVDAISMTVATDAGREVRFDLRDYNDIDHGYAATIHKAQGMTVDRVHVLATPGMDRHAAYVALSRHRDRVDLHYGHDDFADHTRLARALSRERGKDMASDYQQPLADARLPSGAGSHCASGLSGRCARCRNASTASSTCCRCRAARRAKVRHHPRGHARASSTSACR